ncbi:MAG: c-type cytochrome [Candidatus Eisenbacteria bacterium]
MKRLLIIALAVIALCVLLAGSSFVDETGKDEARKEETGNEETGNEEARTAAMPVGQKVFTEAKCQMCHTVYSSGIGEPPAEDAEAGDDVAGQSDLSTTGVGRTAQWMSLFMQKKETLNDKKHVLSFNGSDEDLATLVDWLLTLKPAEVAAPEAEKAEATEAEKGE